MTYLIILCILLFTVLGISYYAYRTAFLSPKREQGEYYELPEGEQYEEHLKNIQMWIDEMQAIPFEKIHITSHEGKQLYGRYYHTKEGAPIEIMFHGYKSSAYLDFCGGIKFAIRSGHNILIVDQRSHGNSDGTTITFGIKERHDCLSWIHYLNNRFGIDTPIILSGLSMGAATVLMASNLNLPDNVTGIVADCPYSSPKEILLKVCRDMHYPATLMFPFIKLGALLFGHFNLTECDALSCVKESKVPILIFHGDDDRFVPCDMSLALKKANPEQITLEIVPNAGHGLCYVIGPKQYEDALKNFYQEIL